MNNSLAGNSDAAIRTDQVRLQLATRVPKIKPFVFY